jgi:hypothetical protein
MRDSRRESRRLRHQEEHAAGQRARRLARIVGRAWAWCEDVSHAFAAAPRPAAWRAAGVAFVLWCLFAMGQCGLGSWL